MLKRSLRMGATVCLNLFQHTVLRLSAKLHSRLVYMLVIDREYSSLY